ncbi:MAG: Uma2 family endonuclease [Acidobacteria bacterium]|nr:Uma2 family endonuclease [Acidobacteriota bacterium]
MDAQVLKRLFSVDEFHQMAEAGAFGEDDRLELLDGEIVQMTPIGSRHAACVNRLNEAFSERCRASAIVHVQNPLTLGEGTEFYPDIALLQRRADFYSQSHPRAADVLSIVEVADTTGDYDRRVTVPRYARAGVPEVWVVDLHVRIVDIFRQVQAGAYRDERHVGPGESLSIPGVPGQQIAVADILV